MCGLTGWVDYTRRLEGEDPAIRAMTNTLALRGPDAEGIWKHRHALLGHRRLAVIDLSGGTQPMVYRFADGQEVSLVYTGEVYNHDALRDQLRQAGHEFQTRSDTEVVLHAYLEWGERCCDHLTGMFAFALFDGRDGHLLLVRDRLGIKPLFYARHREGLLFGSEIKAILAHPEFTTGLEVTGLVDVLTLSKGTAQTPFRNLMELLPGHFLSWRPNGQMKIQCYWKVRRQEHQDDLQTTVQQTRELVTHALGSQLYADVPVCSLLSGGLDSTTLTAIAQRIVKAKTGGDINSFSVDFTGQSAQFKSDDLRPDQDQPFALLAAEFIGSRHQTVLIDNEELISDLAREEVFRAKDVPFTFGDMDTSLNLLFREIRKHSTVAISGEGADEVFGGYGWFRDPQVIASASFPWASRVKLPAAFINADFNRQCDLAQYQQASYDDALRQVEHLAQDSPHERRMRELCHMHLKRWMVMLLDRKDRLSMCNSLEVRVPFTDHQLVEYIYNVPWSIKSKDGEEKWLLKQACADFVPEAVLKRRKSPYPTSADLGYERFLRQSARQLLQDTGNPVFGIISHAYMAEELRQPEGHFNTQMSRHSLETALALDAWLRLHGISV
ncbi:MULTISPECIES: asparagine synthase (glutamine-hydrolyzing) [Pseudomonas]|uniref:asparagine synthase (glutamine-hydrolyzing) n=1 Tax=Pseudomonas TaxID=286 RepID=UPI000B34E023|nr:MULTISPECIES: asparagine synthase (glutamine-hydrolyzing) [Pseudomonas]PMY66407.1 asparagine synthase (glutamine-hydrolyzing) [Pseudomonas sp. FW305-25]PMY73570.1 asparagine synthase (glutamine-hydrolyzing) [Pseudomonas sp. FW126-L8]PNA80484.1 asparagine synthase (glutamine-hydrolyzing) [Pseudomonas sp. FW305-76]